MKLGKLAAKKDPRNLKLATYLPSLPPIPAACDWSHNIINWGMMLNDSIGDCTCAAAGHLIEQWTANAGVMVVPPDTTILSAYEAITGYKPDDSNTDNGANELDVLNYWRQTGIAGHTIGAFVSINPGNVAHVKASVYIFGGCYIGVQLPLSAQDQNIWDVPEGGAVGTGSPGSWGGHAVEVVSYNTAGLTVVTWGALMPVTWNFWNTYCDEAYAILSNDFLVGGTTTPDGFNLAALNADLKDVTN